MNSKFIIEANDRKQVWEVVRVDGAVREVVDSSSNRNTAETALQEFRSGARVSTQSRKGYK